MLEHVMLGASTHSTAFPTVLSAYCHLLITFLISISQSLDLPSGLTDASLSHLKICNIRSICSYIVDC